MFYMFWIGIYEDASMKVKFRGYLFIMSILLLERSFEKWLAYRFGLTLQKMRRFKTLEEQIYREERILRVCGPSKEIN